MLTEDSLHAIIEGQKDLVTAVMAQHKSHARDFKEIMTKHEDDHHPETVPPLPQVMTRTAAVFRRIDKAWDKMWSGMGMFVLVAVGYGLLAMLGISINLAGVSQ